MKYTLEERLKIGKEIYENEIIKYDAVNKYGISKDTARDYMRLYRDTYKLPPKKKALTSALDGAAYAAPLRDCDDNLESLEELKLKILKLEIENARLKKGYTVEGDGAERIVTFYDNLKTK